MNPTRKRRLWLVLTVLAAAVAATALVTLALQRNVAYLYTPSEIINGDAGAKVRAGDAVFRLGGMVSADSFQRAQGSMQARFRVTDGDGELEVHYTGILPDLFREKQAVVATGRMDGQIFMAEQVLAKHDETYVPKELADKMGLAHKKHNVPAASEMPAALPMPER